MGIYSDYKINLPTFQVFSNSSSSRVWAIILSDSPMLKRSKPAGSRSNTRSVPLIEVKRVSLWLNWSVGHLTEERSGSRVWVPESNIGAPSFSLQIVRVGVWVPTMIHTSDNSFMIGLIHGCLIDWFLKLHYPFSTFLIRRLMFGIWFFYALFCTE